MDFGEKLFELRKEKNLSQEEVADRLNVSRQSVSKWETNQSVPDFDKIIPLCELFGIGAEELLTGKKPEEQNRENEIPKEENRIPTREEIRSKSAKVVSSSVLIYILAIAFFIVAVAVLCLDPVIVTAIFLGVVGVATARIIRHYMSIPKFEKTSKEIKETEIMKQMNGIVGAICFILYFLISFTTMAWHVTWIIFIIDALICQIIRLFFMLKEEKINE